MPSLKRLRLLLIPALCWAASAVGEVVIIGHPSLHHLDRLTVERIYTGKVVEAYGQHVCALDLPVGDPLRNRFLARWLGTDEDRYTAYWTVRRYVGKGTPPEVVPSVAKLVRLVTTQPGCIGYADDADLLPGTNVLAR